MLVECVCLIGTEITDADDMSFVTTIQSPIWSLYTRNSYIFEWAIIFANHIKLYQRISVCK